jgi:hypothetical protein
MTEQFSSIISILEIIRNTKSIIDSIPIKLFFPPNQGKLISLQKSVNSLDDQIRVVFPKIAQLIRSYSATIAEVKVSKALSDKVAEILGIVPDSSSIYTPFFINQLESNHGRIETMISHLPPLDNLETGALNEKMNIIRDHILDLKKIDEKDSTTVKQLFDKISTYYTDIQRILSRLLEKILIGFEFF